MKKNSLTSNKGLSLSQAQSVSNLANQKALEIGNKLSSVNNFSKVVKVGKEEHTTVKARPLPIEVVALLKEKAGLHAVQAFLMENIKAKDAMLQQIKKSQPDTSAVTLPEKPKYSLPNYFNQVDEDFGWSQLTVPEINEFTEAEAFASHVGQFIHKNGVLENLRNELPTLPDIEWMTITDGVKSPVTIKTHHTPEQLLKIHEELAGLHRDYESRVNYFKSKVKNITTAENARIAKVNADLQNEADKINDGLRTAYELAQKKAVQDIQNIKNEFEKTRQASIKEVAAMRIEIDTRFKPIVDSFMSKLTDKQE